MVATEEKKVECFIMGLRFDIQGVVSTHLPLDYATTLQLAEMLDDRDYATEDTQTHLDTTVFHKRKREHASPTSSKVPQHKCNTRIF